MPVPLSPTPSTLRGAEAARPAGHIPASPLDRDKSADIRNWKSLALAWMPSLFERVLVFGWWHA